MTEWQGVRLGDVVEIVSGGTPKSAVKEYWGESIHWITPKDMGKLKSDYVDDTKRKISQLGLEKSSAKLIPVNSVILSTRAPIGHLAINQVPMSFNQGCRGLIPSKKIDVKFLFYFLKVNKSLLDDLGRGTTFKELQKNTLAEMFFSYPPLSEQREIVAKLDRAFDKIDRAIRNIQQNINNSHELKNSVLATSLSPKTDWQEVKLGDVALVSSGNSAPQDKRYFEGGKHNFYRTFDVGKVKIGYISSSRDKLNECGIDGLRYFEEGTILFPKSGASTFLNHRVILQKGGYVANHLATIKAKESQILGKCLFYFLCLIDARNITPDANYPSLRLEHIKEIKVLFPPLSEQKEIVAFLDKMSDRTQRLETLHQQKLDALSELKQSLLQKAFAGELTIKAKKADIVPFPQKLPDMSTTDLHAGILAIAYQRHEGNRRHIRTFGSVKAEKIAHMVEADIGIDLGRNPVKDAAGPNDYRHLQQVMHRARKKNWFNFRGGGGRFYFDKEGNFEGLVERTQAALGEHREAVEQLIDIFVVMKTEQAEIVATIFAAWNNLLIDNKPVADENIVYEARENWHQDKLDIERGRFFKAIKWIKKKKLVPKGRGKLVKERENS